MGSALTSANIAIKHKQSIAKNRITSVCNISTSSDRVGLWWKIDIGGGCKGFISFSNRRFQVSGFGFQEVKCQTHKPIICADSCLSLYCL